MTLKALSYMGTVVPTREVCAEGGNQVRTVPGPNPLPTLPLRENGHKASLHITESISLHQTGNCKTGPFAQGARSITHWELLSGSAGSCSHTLGNGHPASSFSASVSVTLMSPNPSHSFAGKHALCPCSLLTDSML